MTSDQFQIVVIAVAWSGSVGLVGLLVAWTLRQRPMRWVLATVAVVAVAAVLAGVVGTARAMFLSQHDFEVILLVGVVAGAVAVAVALAVGVAFSRWSRSIREDTRTLGVAGEVVAEVRGPSELQALSEELTRTSRRLSESREREARLDLSRRELVSWVSHDLRTPLAGMRAMAEALEDGLAEDRQRYYQQIRSEVDRMVRMVDDLFELSRIHAGVLTLSPQLVTLGDLVSEAVAGADPLARAHGVRLDGSFEPAVGVTVDPAGLSRVISNLLVNAIRHTPADGVVEISGRTVPDGVELSVTDACGGMSPEDLERVFDVAWRGEAARTPPADEGVEDRGGGLGLAIVKGIVEAHHGSVAVANHARGCRFVVLLPA